MDPDKISAVEPSLRFKSAVVRYVIIGTLIVFALLVAWLEQRPVKRQSDLLSSYGNLPLILEENRGQVDARVDFIARAPGHTIFLSPAQAVMSLRSPGETASSSKNLRMKILGADDAASAKSERRANGQINYLVGKDSSKWITDVPAHEQVRYKDVYQGIDVVYYGNNKQLEYDFVVAPGVDPRTVEIAFDGADTLAIDAAGDLVLSLGEMAVRQAKPIVYQEINGTRRWVEGQYVFRQGGHIRFDIGPYDTNAELVIDPTLIYSTYLGGSGGEQISDIAVDPAGIGYLRGETSSPNFPTVNAFDSTFNPGIGPNELDVFIAKLNVAGNGLIYSTYIGGTGTDANVTGNDACRGIAIDAAGSAYAVGQTRSANFPTANAIQSTYGGGITDGFLLKLSPAGNALVFSTYVGGDNRDDASGIALDSAGNIYVAGSSSSSNFPTVNPIQATFKGGLGDATISKLNPSATAYVYSTYLGGGAGAAIDAAFNVAVDPNGNAYITGRTSSTDFPTVNAIQATYGGGNDSGDAFVTKVNSAGSALVYSTYLGGVGNDIASGIDVDTSGNAYICGDARSSNFPTANALDVALSGPQDAFITKLNPAGSTFVYSTYFGGDGSDSCYDLDADAAGNADLSGSTDSTNFPTINPIQGTFGGGGSDITVAQINTGGSAVLFSSYLGGSDFDRGNAVYTDNVNIYAVGGTGSSNFPTVNPLQATNGGGFDGFVSKIRPTATPLPTAAGVEISGRVIAPDGRGVRNAVVTLTDSQGNRRSVITSSFGVYQFNDVESGGSYVLNVASKRYRFEPKAVHLLDSMVDIDFVAIEPN